MNDISRKSTDVIKRASCMVIAFLLCGISSVMAQKEIPAESDAQGAKIVETAQFKNFISKYITAVNAKNRKALRELYDPVSQAAMAKDKKGSADVLDAAVEEKIPAKHEVVVSTIGPQEPLMFQDFGTVYAVRPTALVQIRSSSESDGKFSSSTAMIFVAQSGDHWYQVWSNPPDEKKMDAAMQKGADDERQKETSVKASGVAEYHYVPNPPDNFTMLYNWVVRMTAEDSKKVKYEIAQIDQPEGGTPETKVLIGPDHSWMDAIRPGSNGFLGFKLGIGDKAVTSRTEGMFREPLFFFGLGSGVSWTDSVFLPGNTLGEVVVAEQGAPLVDGTLRLIRFNTKDADGRKFVTDVVLRPTSYAATGGLGEKPGQHWFCAPGECSHPMTVPEGYSVTGYGKGEYAVTRTGDRTFGSISITFQAKDTLEPEALPGARQVPMKIRGRQFFWRVYNTDVDGKPIIRKEVLMPNFLPRNKESNQADYILMRVDAPTQQGINTLAPVAHGIIRDAL